MPLFLSQKPPMYEVKSYFNTYLPLLTQEKTLCVLAAERSFFS